MGEGTKRKAQSRRFFKSSGRVSNQRSSANIIEKMSANNLKRKWTQKISQIATRNLQNEAQNVPKSFLALRVTPPTHPETDANRMDLKTGFPRGTEGFPRGAVDFSRVVVRFPMNVVELTLLKQ